MVANMEFTQIRIKIISSRKTGSGLQEITRSGSGSDPEINPATDPT